jgi:hypothetical protein
MSGISPYSSAQQFSNLGDLAEAPSKHPEGKYTDATFENATPSDGGGTGSGDAIDSLTRIKSEKQWEDAIRGLAHYTPSPDSASEAEDPHTMSEGQKATKDLLDARRRQLASDSPLSTKDSALSKKLLK